jgi:hypothetical protein
VKGIIVQIPIIDKESLVDQAAAGEPVTAYRVTSLTGPMRGLLSVTVIPKVAKFWNRYWALKCSSTDKANVAQESSR